MELATSARWLRPLRESFDSKGAYWYKTRQLLTLKGTTMRNSQRSNEEKQTSRKAKMKAVANETRHSQNKPTEKDVERPTHIGASSSQVGRVVTEEQYRARVSQKAYELYEKRQAVTQLEDWLEAERLVKIELLAEGQWAGSV
jgi:hypothetical protein